MKTGRPKGRKPTLNQKKWLSKRGIDWFFWLVESETHEQMLLRHRMTGQKKIVFKEVGK
jgi:hypothetical protein